MTDEPPPALLALLDLCHRARAAATPEELAFLLVNDTRQLAPYRQAAFWMAAGGVRTLSGVVQPDADAPCTQWLNRLCGHLASAAIPSDPTATVPAALPVDRASLPGDLAQPWAEWLPQAAHWCPLGSDDAGITAGLLLAADAPLSDDALALLQEWLHAWQHAWQALQQARARQPWWSPARWGHGSTASRRARPPWWRRRGWQLAVALAGLTAIPVRLTVLAPGELVPADPVVVRAPLDGVIGQFHVQPNEAVRAEQPLFSFDDAAIASRLDVARQALATAEAEYRQFAQLALSDNASKAQLAALVGRINEKQAEADFLQSQLARGRVLAPRDGMALFDDPTEWTGRPVQTGERVMRLARPDDVEIEAWLPIGDAVPLAPQAPVRLVLAATPFVSFPGTVRYVAHDAMPRPDGTYAYRLRARLDEAGAPQGAGAQRIGLKGTARVYGDWVPLGYWVMRRPLAAVRQWLAV